MSYHFITYVQLFSHRIFGLCESPFVANVLVIVRVYQQYMFILIIGWVFLTLTHTVWREQHVFTELT